MVAVKTVAGRGCGFVQYGSRQEAEAGMRLLQGSLLGEQQSSRPPWCMWPGGQGDAAGGRRDRQVLGAAGVVLQQEAERPPYPTPPHPFPYTHVRTGCTMCLSLVVQRLMSSLPTGPPLFKSDIAVRRL